MRIAILIPKLDCNAPKPLSQAERLAKENNDVTIFTFSVVDVEPQKAKLFIIGLPESSFWSRVYQLIFPLDLWKTIRCLRKLKDYDLIIAHLYPMTWLAYLARKLYRLKYVFWYHGIPEPRFYPYLYERIYLRLYILLTRFTTRNADGIVSVSKFARAEFKKYTGRDSGVEYNEVDPQRFHRGIDGAEVRARYNLDDLPVVFCLGRICPQKGFHLLIRAFRVVKRTIPDAKLVIGGRPDYSYYLNQLKGMADGSVIFAGYIPTRDLPGFYAMCDLYATCSLWETFNIPVAEAQACGKPVVAFNIGPHPEVIDSNGILVEPENIEKFAQACIRKLKQVRAARK